MDHKVKSILKIVLLLVIIASLGLFASKGGITGVTGGAVTEEVACYADQDCDDKMANTEDICKNPGTEYSLCVNRPIESRE